MTKAAIVVGHNARAQGAVRVTDGVSEFVWNSDLADMIRDHAPSRVKVFYRQAGIGYSAEIDRVYAETDAWGADVTIELHFNSVVDRTARGCLTLSSGTTRSRALAEEVQPRMAAALGVPDRGIRNLSRGDRGGRSLWQGRAPAIMVEPWFGSNPEDCAAADLHKDKLAEAIYRGAMEFLGVSPNPDPSGRPPAPTPTFPNQVGDTVVVSPVPDISASIRRLQHLRSITSSLKQIEADLSALVDLR